MKQLLAYQRKLREARQVTAKLDGRLSKLEQVRSPGLPCANPTRVCVLTEALCPAGCANIGRADATAA